MSVSNSLFEKALKSFLIGLSIQIMVKISAISIVALFRKNSTESELFALVYSCVAFETKSEGITNREGIKMKWNQIVAGNRIKEERSFNQ